MEFDRICSTGNLSITIMTPDRSIVMASSDQSSTLLIIEQFMRSIYYRGKDNVVYASKTYRIEKQKDEKIKSDFLVLSGNLPDGNTVVIRTAIESLEESAKISNRCVLIAGIISLIASVFVSSLITRRITKPITELTSLSVKMKNLDFDAKYNPRKKENEIDVLGNNFNEMSITLENTIGELKAANNKLVHDLDIMEKSDTMRKEFLSNVSHELKTPLALIEGYAEGLRDGVANKPEDTTYYLNVIIDESKKMDEMVKQLLSLNQLEFGQNNIQMSRINISNAVKEIVHNSDILIRKNDIKVRFDNKKDLFVWGDEFSLEQIVSNYLSNAIHYCKNEKEIEIKLEEKGNEVAFSVYNTGDRIPEESIDHIWEKFYKADKARTREYGGSGIGLSIVKALSDIYNKKCGVENKKDGVLFYFIFDKA
jgi:signal transduction histidine kinase